MAFQPNSLAAASNMPGLQNSGSFSVSAYITGTVQAAGTAGANETSNLVGTFNIPLQDPSVITVMRVNVPLIGGQLVDRWVPLIGTVVLSWDTSGTRRLILYAYNSPVGRTVSYNFVNTDTANSYTYTNFPINIYGHLYTIPW